MKFSCAICAEVYNLTHFKKLLDVAEIFSQLTSLEVSSLNEVEQLRVCEICHQKLIDFHSFRSLCVAAHTKLSQDHEELSKLCIVKLDEAEFPTDCPGEDGTDVLADNDASFEEPSLVIEPITSVVVKEEPDAHEYDEERPQDTASEEEFVPPEPKRRGRKKLVTKEKSAPVTRRVELACHLCDDKFRTQNRLDGHLRMHQGLKPALCKECGKEFAGWRSLRRHMKEKHLKLDIGYFPCDYEGCTYSYTTRKVLLQHKKKHEPGWVKPVPKKCVCETCGKTFSSNGSLKKHTLIHTGELQFRCEICDKRYCTAYKLKVHVMRHQGIKNYECTYCGQKKTTPDELKRHMNFHTKEKVLNCDLCGQVFLSSGNYSRHLKIVHCGIKNFKCPHCERSFGKAETLKNHIMTHTGEKPYECAICSKRFIQQCALKTHLKTHDKRKKEPKQSSSSSSSSSAAEVQ
ncbi:zinc finger protein 501-like [Anopheles merus]|uniref:C2H2-type domain-containing protein n=1 Tax=Anopheles merus TaxID=30066 RepID=A0A182UYF6_ANOME|nr:zinc finger protein 501-like [Anopheles merus]